MTLGRCLTVSSTALVLTGFLSILITGSYTAAVSVGIGVTLVHGFLGERLPLALRVPRWVWNLVALGLLAYLAADTFFGAQDLVGNGVTFVVYLQIVKLLSPKTNRDWLQIYLLSFLHLLASTIVSEDISFSLPYVAYIVLATWTLAMFNLLSAQEAAAANGGGGATRALRQSRDVVTRPFLATTALMALSILSFTMVVFFLFPRLSLGHFFKRVNRRQSVAGFSEQVRLGEIGSIKANNAVAMRVELENADLDRFDIENLYWRGTAADAFDGRVWSKSFSDRDLMRVDSESGLLEVPAYRLGGPPRLAYRVFLEPMSTPILFGADELLRVTWEKARLERLFRGSTPIARDAYDGIHFASTDQLASDLTYLAESLLGFPDPGTLRAADTRHDRFIREHYLSLPDLHPDVRNLLASIPAAGENAYDRALAIQGFLEKNYAYTLEVNDAGAEDPLHFFFLGEKRGHCEYFSTALAVAFRFHGIPARQVMGFRGGERNPIGKYIIVRQRDAHTWVEAFFPGSGWVRFDPSPMEALLRRESDFARRVRQYIDYLRLRWSKYVLDYDLQSQAFLAERFGRSLTKFLRQARGGPDGAEFERDPAGREKLFSGAFGKRAPAALLALLAAAFSWLRWRARKKRLREGRLSSLLDLLARAGYRRTPAQTPWELAARVEEKRGRLRSLRALLEMYGDERFGGKSVPEAEWSGASAALKRDLRTGRAA